MSPGKDLFAYVLPMPTKRKFTHPIVAPGDSARPSSAGGGVEVVRGGHSRGGFRAAIFDFDGTLSLLRRNWQDVMIPMMVDVLVQTRSGETREQLHEQVEEFVMRLNGRQTIYQMIELADQVRRRGAPPRAPLEYKQQYHEMLWRQVSRRIDAVRGGQTPRDEMTVPGCEALLAALQQRGIALYLASGTDIQYVRDELAVLGLEGFFGPRVWGALDDHKRFSKAMLIQQIVADGPLRGEQLLGFGDGFVEIEEVKRVGGLAVGVASDENTRAGVNAWKRERLIRAGADVIIGDYRELERLLATIGVV